MNVLLSIKPTFVERIFNGEKLYEFRKVIFKKDKIDHIYIYSSYPVKKIVGRFEIGGIIEDSPDRLWETCNGSSGLNYQEFFSYFSDKDRGYAILHSTPIILLYLNTYRIILSFNNIGFHIFLS